VRLSRTGEDREDRAARTGQDTVRIGQP
jgi:hypothetical protein